MNLIDLLRFEARESGQAVKAWLNGVPVLVKPDGKVERREQIVAFEKERASGRYIRKES